MESSRGLSAWRELLPLLAAVVTTLFVAFRILAIATFDPETAYGVLQAGGTAAVIVGAILSSAGQLAVLLAAACLFLYNRVPNDSNHIGRDVVLSAGILFGLVSLGVAPVINLFTLFIFLILGIAVEIQFRKILRKARNAISSQDVKELQESDEAIEKYSKKMQRRIERFEGPANALKRTLSIILATMVAAVAINPTPWLPAEQIAIRNSQPIIAYVLSESGSNLVILTANSRHIEYVNSGLVVGRKLCSESQIGFLFKSLPELFSPQRYLTCVTNSGPHVKPTLRPRSSEPSSRRGNAEPAEQPVQ